MALEAGCDLNCGCTYAYIMAALQDGLVTEEQITESCIRVFTTRFLLGMFDGSEYDDIPYEVVECKEHRNLAVEAAHKGMVLLKMTVSCRWINGKSVRLALWDRTPTTGSHCRGIIMELLPVT